MQRTSSLMALLLLALSPLTASAAGFGEITLQSHIGEPLRAKVALLAAPGESIDPGCVSLQPPRPDAAQSADYLTQASLSVVREGDNQYVLVRGSQPFTGVFAHISLQLQCAGQGATNRLYTVLPSIAEATKPVEAPAISTAEMPPAVATQPAAKPAPLQPKRSESRPARPRADVSARKPVAAAPTTRRKASSDQFVLRLSSNLTDEAKLAKLSENDRSYLLDQQKILASDDQTASFLTLQQQVRELQNQLGDLRKQLGQPPAAASGVAPIPASVPAAASAPAAVPVPVKPPVKKPVPPPAPAPVPEGNLLLELAPQLGMALVAILALLLGLRVYKRRLAAKWHGGSIVADDEESIEAAEPVLAQPEPAQPVRPAVVVTPPDAAVEPSVGAQPAPGPVHDARQQVIEPERAPAPQRIEVVEFEPANRSDSSEIDAMMEEAELYAVHGHPEVAIRILSEIGLQHPDKAEAWLLLLSIYSSLKRRDEFDAALARFQAQPGYALHVDEVAQLLQRFDETVPAGLMLAASSSNQRTPLGAILLDIGALTEEDLMEALAVFNPKRDGRIGGFLVARGKVTDEQVEEALRIQREQSGN